jgi:hypothetical protein
MHNKVEMDTGQSTDESGPKGPRSMTATSVAQAIAPS